MKGYRRYTILFGLLLFLAGPLFGSDQGVRLRRYALFIGSNNGGRDRVLLRYASSDTRAMAEVFYQVGGLHPEDSILCIDPSKRKVERELARIKEMIRSGKREDRRTEFFLYYSGHSNEEGLLINGELLTYRSLREEMKSVDADISVAILDSCASGAFIRIKGGKRVAPFMLDESTSMKGQVYLSSSSEDEASQESDEIGASFFTHSLISALRGAADFSSDRQITIHEAYQYARSDTIARTENTFAGTQHPSWHIELTGTGDLVLTDLRELAAGVVLAAELEGRIYIRDGSQKLVAEVKKSAGTPITLALPVGSYTITSRTDDQQLESIVTLYEGSIVQVTIGDFVRTGRVAGRLRGDTVKSGPQNVEGQTGRQEMAEEPSVQATEEELQDLVDDYIDKNIEAIREREAAKAGGGRDEETDSVGARSTETDSDDMADRRFGDERAWSAAQPIFLPARVSFTPGLSFPFGYPDAIVGFSVNVLLGVNRSIRGAELGSIINITEAEVYGAQFAGVGNIVSGNVTGFQAGGVFNIADGELRGGQSAGVFNLSTGECGWLQAAGVFNINTGTFAGAQLGGVFSINSGYFAGAQLSGVFNINEGYFSGAQMGGIFTINRGFRGFQGAGVVNVATDQSHGVQAAGVLNIADGLNGAQFGVINAAREVNGTQIGVVNSGGTVSGFQLGVINVAGTMNGFPLGLINISENGLMSLSLVSDLNGFWGLDFQSGKVLYTRLSAGTLVRSLNIDPVYTSSAGLGLHFDLGPFFIEGDGSAATTFHVYGHPVNGYREALPYPEFRIKGGLLLFNRFGLYAGLKAVLHVEGMVYNEYAHTGVSYSFPVARRLCTFYHQFIWGVTVNF